MGQQDRTLVQLSTSFFPVIVLLDSCDKDSCGIFISNGKLYSNFQLYSNFLFLSFFLSFFLSSVSNGTIILQFSTIISKYSFFFLLPFFLSPTVFLSFFHVVKVISCGALIMYHIFYFKISVQTSGILFSSANVMQCSCR